MLNKRLRIPPLITLSKKQWSLIIFRQEKIFFKSRAQALRPLLRYLSLKQRARFRPVIYDKYIGRAAALLMVPLRPEYVCTPVISRGGAAVFKRYHISFEALTTVAYLMHRASKDMCQWEKLARGHSPAEFLALAKKGEKR